MKSLLIFRLSFALALGLAATEPAPSTAGELTEAAAAPHALETEPAAAATAVPSPAPAAPPVPAAPAAPPAPASPATVTASAAPTGPSDLLRRRCKIAGAVLLGVAGATVVAFFGTIVYNAVAAPDALSLPAGPRLGFGLSAVALGITGSALLGYSVNAPGRPAVTPPRSPAPSPNLPPAPAPAAVPVDPSPTLSGSGSVAALELRF